MLLKRVKFGLSFALAWKVSVLGAAELGSFRVEPVSSLPIGDPGLAS